jgi:hypothetical protein
VAGEPRVGQHPVQRGPAFARARIWNRSFPRIRIAWDVPRRDAMAGTTVLTLSSQSARLATMSALIAR